MDRNELKESEFEQQEQLERMLGKKHKFASQSDEEQRVPKKISTAYDLNRYKEKAKSRIGNSDKPPEPEWEKNQ